jgi:hypothetical protein
MTDLAEIKKGYPFNQDEHYWEVIALAEQLQAENAQLKAHNRQLVEALEKISKMDAHDKQHRVCCAMQHEALIALQTQPAKLALAEAAVLRAAEAWKNKSCAHGTPSAEQEAGYFYDSIRRMQEARGDGN